MVRNRVDDELKRDLSGQELSLLLRKAHLPDDYNRLGPKRKQKARLRTLHDWYDPSKPQELCNSVVNFLAALFLWVEFYYKPAENNLGIYHFQDPVNKYEAVRRIMEPSVHPGLPAKSILTATRRMGKTQTAIVEMIPLIAITRPFSPVLVAELNADRTGEEILKIKNQIEENERIHADFGAEGVLYPRRGEWSQKTLKFIHHHGSSVKGFSFESAQRGRGCVYGVVDDPEDEKNTFNKEWRIYFFNKLFGAFIPMLARGGVAVWIGTPVDGCSCLSQAISGLSEKDETGGESVTDPRLEDWRKIRYTLIEQNADGNYFSNQPDRITVETFRELMRMDPITARKEILCEPVTPGIRAFRRHQYRHGFMHCTVEGGTTDTEFFLDLHTGETRPWSQFLSELRVFGAGDLADGQSAQADPGALVWIGIGLTPVIYVLDVYNKRCLAEHLIEQAYNISMGLDCEKFGWEKAAMQCAINRIAQRLVEELRAQGKTPPIFREVENAKKNKVRRILTMTPLFGRNEIRFLHFGAIQASDGKTYYSVENSRKDHYLELIHQLDEFTDEGLRGHDDAADALEMAIRVAGNARGEVAALDENKTDAMMKRWDKVGINFSSAQVPMEAWSPKMHKQSEEELFAFSDVVGGIVPYQ